MDTFLETSVNTSKTALDTANTVITEEMAYDYASFLFHLWKSKQEANKIDVEGRQS